MLGEQLRSERHKRGWTQAELAERADCKAQTVRAIERDRRRPQGRTLRRLEAALGLPPGTLLAAVGRRSE
jgi:transcriptional regulator with XRE-family HTH domain